ncbi:MULTISPECIES: HVO_2072 family ArtA-dependent S-layer glycoprotein [unclassified Halorubrum]|uniref:HVO_2072 family ArtA-dependent S-layer glycoprotein n=1 Tax=unclassified Halorubrum TaxID=2642239 RepID=UPI0010FA44A2|nr:MULTISPECIES: HVO_2072 family ArtA-dependent S-layer glycoprotein [unclassified Halorubrum]TKX44688.1 major cell surface glycoprotein [Halorubrum sp. ARQ200]TKX48696.1 major cell surface glycoprotein [Halorubrum sp. ASP121]
MSRTKRLAYSDADKNQTMTNDNTRSKANAVFFSAIMVISMVAVGFAAAPAAAAVNSGSVDFNDQTLDGSTVEVDYSGFSSDSGDSAVIAVTYENSDGDAVLAGVSDTGSSASSGTATVTISDAGGFPGQHTAHLFDSDDVPGVSAGGVVSTTGFDTDTAQVADSERSSGSNLVADGNVVYQGEDDVVFVGNATQGTIQHSELSGTSGNREGTPLQDPIPEDEETGTYDLNGPTDGDGGFSTTVISPRITTAEVQLTDTGGDISEVGPDSAGQLKVFAEWNFGNAEGLAITVEDPSGADITNEVLVDGSDESGSTDVLQYGENESDAEDASVGLDLAGEDAGEYTVIFEGNDEIDQVVEEYTVTLTNEDDLSIDVAEDSVTQGSNVDYTVSGGTDGQVRLVAIEENDFADGVTDTQAGNIFRNVEDVSDTGYNSSGEYAWALVEIDGTTAVGSIETKFLDTSDATVEVYSNDSEVSSLNSDFLEDDVDLEVTEGSLSLDSPSDDYIIGSEVDVNGTAEAADEVRVYALNNNNWEIVQINGQNQIDVDSDDTFEVEDVTLSQGNGGGNDILAFEGRYQIGVIDADDARNIEIDTGSNSEINTSAWTSNDGTRSSINVESGGLTAQFGTIDGQFAIEDSSMTVNGTAEGQSDVLVAFVDERGNTDVTVVSVDNDGTFDEEDVSVDLSQGAASGHVISLGRDDTVGDGDLPGVGGFGGASDPTISDLESFIDELEGESLTGNQVRDRIVAQTTEADATDDLMISTTFRVTEASVSVDSVYPEGAQADGINPVAVGETMVVEGSTNLQPDDNSVVLNVLNQNDNSVESVSVEEWGNDGQFTLTVDTSGLETGTYVLEADSGDTTDTTDVELVEERQTDDGASDGDDGGDGDDGASDGDDGGDGDDGASDGDDGGDGDDGASDGDDGGDGDDGASDGDDGGDGSDGSDGGDESTEDGTPGFGALVALVALIAAALLATRRNN